MLTGGIGIGFFCVDEWPLKPEFSLLGSAGDWQLGCCDYAVGKIEALVSPAKTSLS